MENLAEEIVSIIGDYREEDGVNINTQHVIRWVTQFDQEDREFLLTELLHILPKSYISKSYAIDELKRLFSDFAKGFGYDSITQLLNDTKILRCQASTKSQSVLLEFLNVILLDTYKMSVDDCGKTNPKYWLYLDDVLASGGTFKKEIKIEIEKFGVENFMKSPIKILPLFFFLHEWGGKNSKFSLGKTLEVDLDSKINMWYVLYIDNNPRISMYNQNPSFNLAFPLESQAGIDFLATVQDKLSIPYDMKCSEFSFRKAGTPKKEVFFSSEDNRNRYEQILLKQGIEIFNRIGNFRAKGIRPMGFTPPSYKTLGTGSHAFTWRNVSNTCPLVFWWEANDWYPLFSVKNRGN